MQAELQNGNAGCVVFKNVGWKDAGWKWTQDGLREGRDLGNGQVDAGIRLKEYFYNRDAVIGRRFHVLDVVNGGGHGALVDGDDALGHLLRRQAGVGPYYGYNGNIDVRKDVFGHAENGDAAEHRHEHGHDNKGIGPAKGKPDYPHTSP